MLLSVGKCMRLYLYVAQMGLKRGSRVGFLCILHVMNGFMMLLSLDMVDVCIT